MEKNEILSVCIDTVKGIGDKKFSSAQTSEELRAAFIELNGNSTKLNIKTFHRGNALFELIEELIPTILDEGIKTSTNPLFRYVDYRNIALGDEQEFETDGMAQFIVAKAAHGIWGVRRQRINDGQTVKVPTNMYVVRVYEELNRLLAGRVDFNKFVDGVAKAFERYIASAAYIGLSGISNTTPGLSATYVKSGSITEATLLDLVGHVEAANGKKAVILGTKAALRKLGSSVTYSAEQNADLYNQGYLGKIAGVPAFALEQAHKPGTETFEIDDDALWVVATDDKFVKVVNAGEGLLMDREATENADLTKEYIYGQEIGVGVICAAKVGYWHSIV